jgi:hypothetical protein
MSSFGSETRLFLPFFNHQAILVFYLKELLKKKLSKLNLNIHKYKSYSTKLGGTRFEKMLGGTSLKGPLHFVYSYIRTSALRLILKKCGLEYF